MSKIEVFWKHNTIRTIYGTFRNYRSILGRYHPSKLRLKIPIELPAISYQLLAIRNGFTLVEVITAIGVVAILASAVIAAINPLEQFQKSQDSKRKSDLAQVQRALEVYYNDYDRYPSSNASGQIVVANDTNDPNKEWGTSWSPYMDVLPIDPVQSKDYGYWADTDGQSYALYASLDREDKDPQVCAVLPCNNASSNGVICGSGRCNYGVSSPNIAP